MKKYIIPIVAAVFAAFITNNVNAGSTAAPVQTGTATSSGLYGTYDVSVNSNHEYRGQVLDTNPVIDNVLTLHLPLQKDVSLFAQTQQVAATKGTGLFWSNYKGGVNFTFGRLIVGPGYEVITNKNKDLTTQSVITDIYFDDSGLFLPFALNPSLSLGKRVSGKSGTRYELGIEPVLYEKGPVKVVLPAAVGASSSRYYNDSLREFFYGYAAVGVATTYKLSDKVSVTGTVAGYNTDAKLNNKTNNFISTQFGVGVSF